MTKNTKRIRLILLLITVSLTIATVIRFFFVTTDKQKTQMIFSCLQYVAMLIVIALPHIFKKRFNLEIPTAIYLAVACFSFSELVLGDGLNFYGKFGWWDSFLHFQSGYILSLIGVWVIKLVMSKDSHVIYMNRLFLSIFTICFSVCVGACWEIIEYVSDDVLHTNAQQYLESNRGTIASKKDVPLVGHAALADTIKDLSLDLLGSSLVAVAVYFMDEKSFDLRIKRINNEEKDND
ncbi:MAG: hypothetical protein PHH04_00975 [Thomasclavelia sp.]|jgi:hypothetical protein|nr:hypothetical protein [Thomasclavelia sp.]